MTVKELIAHLATLDGDLEVIVVAISNRKSDGEGEKLHG